MYRCIAGINLDLVGFYQTVSTSQDSHQGIQQFLHRFVLYHLLSYLDALGDEAKNTQLAELDSRRCQGSAGRIMVLLLFYGRLCHGD
jgi:hypothetical protein